MGDWAEKKLSDVCNITIGGTPARANAEYWDNDFRTENYWVSIKDMNQKVINTTAERITQKGINNSNAKLVKSGTVLISFKLSIGKVSIAGEDLYTNEAIAALETTDIDDKFLFHGLQKWNLLQDVDQAVKGATLNKEKLKKIRIEIPESRKEQSTIATILTTIDQAIEKTEQLIAKYERIKTGLMQDLLTCGIDKEGNIRSEETHEFKDSPLGRIPREWEVGTVGKDCIIQNSFRKPLSAELRENMKGKYPYFGPTGILDYINEYRVDGKYVLIGEDGDHFLKFISQEMTLLIEGKFNVNNHAHILEGKGDCTTEWIHCFFCHRDITYHLTRQGAGRFKLNKAALSKLPIAIPKSGEQLRIIEKVDGIRNYLQGEKEILKNYRSLKAGLMQDLLTGEVRVDNLISIFV